MSGEAPIAKRRLTIRGIMLGILISAPMLHSESLLLVGEILYCIFPVAIFMIWSTRWGTLMKQEMHGTWLLFHVNTVLYIIGLSALFLPAIDTSNPWMSLIGRLGTILRAAPVFLAGVFLWLVLTRPRMDRNMS